MPADVYTDPATTPSGEPQTETKKSTELADALAAPRVVIIGGKEYAANLITFNGLVKIEEALGDVSLLDLTKVSHQRFILHLTLGMPEEEVGNLLTVKDFADSQGVIARLLRASGLMDDPDEDDTKKKPPVRRAK